MTSSVSTSSGASSLGAPSGGGGGGSGAAGTEPSSSESGAEPPIPTSPAAAVDGAKASASARLAGDHGPHNHHHGLLGGAAPEQAAAEPTDMNGSAITIREGDAAAAAEEEELDALSCGAPSPPRPLSPVAVAAPKQQAASALSISMQRSRAPLSQQQQQQQAEHSSAHASASANAYSPASSFSRSFPDAADAHLVTSSSPALSSNGGHRADDSYDHDHDHEHEHDLDDRASTATRSPPGSPSSLSSWNSYVGGRRGDLADVEDLDLDHHSLGGASGSYTGDGGNAGRWHWHGHHYHHGHGHGHGDVASHEPELETVPEKEEEASQQQQQQQHRAAQHADSTAEHTEDSDDPSLGAASSAFARRSSSGGRARPHHYTGLHRAAPPQAPSASSSSSTAAAAAALPPNSHSHFSTRGLGYVYAQNGLRWSGRPRRKSRVSELGEDGLGLGGAGAGAESPYLHNGGGMASPASSSGTSSPAPELAGALVHPHLSHLHHPSAHPHHAPLSHATGAGAAEDYVTGPPAPPPRSVSPSETIPAVPSRLSLCINAGEEETAVEEDYHPSASAAAAVERSGTIKASTSPVRKARPLAPIDARSKSIESNRTIRERSADSTMTASTFSVRSDATDSTLDSASTPATAAGTPTTASSADDVASVVSSASNDLAATSSTCSGSSVSGSSRLSFAANEDDGDGAETDHTAQTSPPSSPPASPAEAKPTPLPRTNPVRKDSSENVTPTSATTAIPAEASMPQRSRRSSSGAATKKPLRPCFRRLRSARTDAPRASRDSSSEREWYGYRSSHADDERLRSSVGAAQQEYSQQQAGYAPPQPHPHVRFSQAPPEEVRTHSPNDYDRKSCPISTKLSPEDVEELRYMKMELGLLEAKWRAMSACKLEDSRDNGTWGAGYGSDSSEAVEISFGHTPNHNKLAARERRHTSSMTNTPSPGSSPPLTKRLGDLAPFTTSYSPAHSPSNLSTASNSSHHNPFFRPVSPQLPRVPPSPSAMSENGELPQIERERALLGATHCPAKLGRRAHAERVCLMSRFGLLDAPPPPLPGTASKSGYMSSSSVPTFGGNDGSYRGNQRFGASGALGAAGMSTRLGQRGYNDGANTPVAQAPGGASVRSTSLTRTNSGRSSSAPPRSRSGEPPGPQLLQGPELELSARRLLTQQSSGDLRSSAGPGYDDIESAIAASEGTGASTPEATPRGRSTANKGLGAGPGPGPGPASPPLPRSPSLDVSSTAIPRVALKSPSPPPEAFAVAPAPIAAGGKQQRPAPVPLQKTNSSGGGGSGGKTYRASPVASSSGSSPAIATPPLRSPFDTEQEEERELESPALTTPTATTSRPFMLLSTSPPTPKSPSPASPVKAPPPPPEPSSSRPKPKGLPSFSPACATRPYAHSSSHAPRPYAATSSYSSYAAASPAASPGGHLAGKPWTGGMAPRPTSIYGSMGMGAGNGYGHGSPGGAGTAAVTAGGGGSMPGFGGGGGGYDSPASEFYESGSEYDLLG